MTARPNGVSTRLAASESACERERQGAHWFFCVPRLNASTIGMRSICGVLLRERGERVRAGSAHGRGAGREP